MTAFCAVATAPTCTEGGYTTYTCACGDTYIADETEAIGHQLGEWIANENEKTRYCSMCDYYESQFVTNDGNVEIESPENPDTDFEVDEITPTDDSYIIIDEAIGDNGTVVKAFEINLKNKDGVHVQPNGTVKVKLPLDWSKNGEYKVYRVEDDGTLTDMNADHQGSHMVFETDHFSKYVIVDVTPAPETPENPDVPDEPYEPETPDVPDTPSEPEESGCDCPCHESRLMRIIYIFISFLKRLFGGEPCCACK